MSVAALPLIVYAVLAPHLGFVAIDPAGFAALQDAEATLRWDNIEGTRHWLGGEFPARAQGAKLHSVVLQPGEGTLLLLPKLAMLRVLSTREPLLNDSLEFWLSNGSGVFIEAKAVRGEDGQNLLLQPQWAGPLLVDVRRPFTHRDALDIALFVSRQEHAEAVDPYRRRIATPQPHVQIRDLGDNNLEVFSTLHKPETIPLHLKDAAHLVIENMLEYGPYDTSRRRHYRIEVSLDGGLPKVFEQEALPRVRASFRVNDELRVLGTTCAIFFPVSPGDHVLEISASAPLYYRIAQRDEGGYLFPGLNAPEYPALDATGEVAWPLGLWSLPRAEAFKEAYPTSETLILAAMRLAHDNGTRDGGMAAAMLVRNTMLAHPAFAPIETLYAGILGSHTFSRDLLPANTFRPLGVAYYLEENLVEPGARQFANVVGGQHVEEMLARVPKGYFVSAVNEGDTLRFQLPERFSPTVLRCALELTSGENDSDFVIRWKGEARRVQVRRDLRPSPEYYEPELGVMALESLGETHGTHSISTLSGPFALTRDSAPMIEAGTVEFMLPADVAEFEIASLTPGMPLPGMALSYRTSKVFALSEEEYYAGLPAGALEAGLFEEFVAGLKGPPESGATNISPYDRYNHWLPLFRLIESRHQLFASFVAAPARGEQENLASGPGEGLARARDLEAEGDALAAIEALGSVRNAGPESRTMQFHLLDRLGETYLSELFARGEFLYGQDAASQELGYAYLAERYRSEENVDMLLALQCSEFYRHPNIEGLQRLVSTLLDTDNFDFALWASLVLPEALRPMSDSVRAAYAQGWWRTFEVWVDRLPSGARQHWRFLEEQRLARGSEAGLNLELPEGAALEEAHGLRAALCAPHPALPDLAHRWSDWQTERAPDLVWKDAADLVDECAGAELIYNIPRDIYFRMFRATPQQAVTLKIAGPVSVRLELRPLLAEDKDEIELDWAIVEIDGLPHRFSMLHYTHAEGLRMEGNVSERLARALQQEMRLGPGIHTLKVQCLGSNALLRAYMTHPEIPLAALPVLSPETLAATCPNLPVPPAVNQHPSLDVRKLYRLPVSDPALPVSPLHLWPPESYVFPGDASVGEAALRTLDSAAPGWEYPFSEQEWRVAEIAASGDDESFVEFAAPTDAPGIRAYMDHLLWLFETQPVLAGHVAILGAALAHDHPEILELRTVFDRMQHSLSWTPLESVQESAGVRNVPVEGWRPESPELRVRKTLLPALRPEEHVLYDYGALLFSSTNAGAIELGVELALEIVEFVAGRPLHLLYQVDAEEASLVTLSPEQPQAAVSVKLPAGDHQLRIAIVDRAVNHFVRVRLFEIAEGYRVPIAQEMKRQYFLATPREAVKVAVAGPAWLRIEESREGRHLSSYKLFSRGVHYPAFAPQSGEALYRFSALTLGGTEPPAESADIIVTYTPVHAPEQQVEAPATVRQPGFEDVYALGKQEEGTWAASVALEERRNTQEDKNVGEDPERFLETSVQHLYHDAPNGVWFDTELLARHRWTGGPSLGVREHVTWAPPAKPWTAELIGSAYVQEMGGYGAGPQEWALQLRGSMSWRQELAPDLYHVPEISLTGRWLSMETNRHPEADDRLRYLSNAQRGLRNLSRSPALDATEESIARNLIRIGGILWRDEIPRSRYAPEGIDQDVFTPYKADHLLGLRLQDTLYYRPWLDTYFYAGAGLGTNERLWSVDNAGGRLGMRVLLREFELGLEYRLTHYFADSDRAVSTERHIAEATFGWEKPLRNGNRLEAQVGVQEAFDGRGPSARIGISYVFGAGRDYRDEAPGTRFFRDLRTRRLYGAWENNAIYETAP